MCGILGGVFKRPLKSDDTAAFRSAISTLAHRGPDADEVVTIDDANAVFAFRRLAIIDLAAGDQPMSLPSGHHIIFNGEIYNYQSVRPALERESGPFRTSSDTEVLLRSVAARGVDGIAPLRGMFGFGFLDVPRRRLILARDRLGVKQLYYAETADGVFFASEPKALIALPWVKRELNASALPLFFNFRSVPAPETLFRGIAKLPPGFAREYSLDDLGTAVERAYWTYPEAKADDAMSAGEALDRFETAFVTAIERRLVSDVPVGAFLSGGLDSSLVVAGIHRLGRSDVQTITATFPESPDDERSFASAVASKFGLANHAVALRAAQFLEMVPRWFDLNDDLVADASSLPLISVSDRARAEGCIVMLAGEGADELFGGYGVYHKFGLLHRASRVIPGRGNRERVVSIARRLGVLRTEDEPRVREYLIEGRGFLGTAALLDSDALAVLVPSASGVAMPRARSAGFADLGAFDFARRIPDDLLVRTDRATMGASIEARVPFLDHDLVELVATLPASARTVPGISKVLLRRLALRWEVPWSTIAHRKIGFNVPIGTWFRGPLRGIWDDVLRRRAVPGLDYGIVADRVGAHLEGRASYDELLWRILSLEAWHARWIDEQPLRWPESPR